MLEFIVAGGWLMWPIILCSIIAMAIVAERFWALHENKVAPKDLVTQVWQWQKNGELNTQKLTQIRNSSPLGMILAIGLINRHHSREIMKESIEEAGRHVAHNLERFLNTLGTIASITPLLGLLGTVIGMIKVFTVISNIGVGDPNVLSEGISEALITTAAGLSVAIPSLMFYRYFRRKIDSLIIMMEQDALKLIAIMHGKRESEQSKGKLNEL